jgi:hypothetical protein
MTEPITPELDTVFIYTTIDAQGNIWEHTVTGTSKRPKSRIIGKVEPEKDAKEEKA